MGCAVAWGRALGPGPNVHDCGVAPSHPMHVVLGQGLELAALS